VKPLEGVVAAMTSGNTTPDASTVAHHVAIVEAAQAYVIALRAWEERTSYNETRRQNLHRAQRALVDAVEKP
jgi:hypothetical protein